jgi:hypothetical protein
LTEHPVYVVLTGASENFFYSNVNLLGLIQTH